MSLRKKDGGRGVGGKSATILYPYDALLNSGTRFGCCKFHARHSAITGAVYTLNVSILVTLLYSWRISANMKKAADLEDVYYGVQIAYIAIVGTQLFMIVLSITLLFGIYKENSGLVVPWIIGCIAFMAMEALAMVYSNVLRDHVNRQFDSLCKAEVTFFLSRALLNVVALFGVIKYYNMLRVGITWKKAEMIEL
ncbi:uncharacterized protein [Bemisia tabaci]|uniref:uncharacterized protein n=1 Tax=Bemisia tabaci TaxID=7038 RepID=UPI0008F9A90F|nr:PREDICTED: uncharacterized protein LOC109036857 [Bemisia tabaci]